MCGGERRGGDVERAGHEVAEAQVARRGPGGFRPRRQAPHLHRRACRRKAASQRSMKATTAAGSWRGSTPGARRPARTPRPEPPTPSGAHPASGLARSAAWWPPHGQSAAGQESRGRGEEWHPAQLPTSPLRRARMPAPPRPPSPRSRRARPGRPTAQLRGSCRPRLPAPGRPSGGDGMPRTLPPSTCTSGACSGPLARPGQRGAGEWG